MKYVLDSHMHTIASGHAYNTIREMTQAASDRGLSLIAITEHCMAMPGTCHEFYFQNFRNLDRNDYALPVLFGAELNIIDEFGGVDMPDNLLPTMDVNIASLHPPCVRKLNKKETTQTVCAVLKNPQVDIIGHLDDDRFPVDYEEVVKVAAAYNKLFEVNNSSLSPQSYRPGAHDNYLRLLEYCEKYGVEIILNSDAHTDTMIGKHNYSEQIIKETGFPVEHIVNDSIAHYMSHLRPIANSYFTLPLE